MKCEQQKSKLQRYWFSIVIGLLALGLGCHRPGYYPGQVPPSPGYQYQPGLQPTAAAPMGPGSVYAGGQMAPQLVEMQRRAQELDSNNRQLTTQLAQMQQQASVYRERADLLARQLEDANRQNSQLMATAQQYADQARGLQASMNSRGSARLTANNSMTGSSGAMQIPGAQIIQEGSMIRVRVASDQLFAPGTAQLNPIALAILDQFSSIVKQQYPRQRVAVESHTDAWGQAPTANVQVANAQAQAVIDYLSQRGGLPIQQMIIVGRGPSFPIADNNTPAGRAENRRIELVITPDTF